jgi:pyridoxal 5'-phosphate synthase pdxT subunit
MTIGVLGLQGDFALHLSHLLLCGADARIVRTRDEIQACDGLVIPGGESTTIGKLLDRMGLLPLLKQRIEDGLPVYGTCAGAILLARAIIGSEQLRIGTMDIVVARNAYGRQVDSFETDLSVPALGPGPLRGVFIRAPMIESVGSGVEVLARFEDRVVLARERNMLAGTFHPELTDDLRVHRHFLDLVEAGVAVTR